MYYENTYELSALEEVRSPLENVSSPLEPDLLSERLSDIPDKPPFRQRISEFWRKRRLSIALGVTAMSAAATVTNNPIGEVADKAVDAAPWVAGGMATSEALFVGGAAAMAYSVKGKIGNPLKLRERIPELARQANGNRIFEAGFWVNSAGAVGTGAVAAAGIIAEMPTEAYPALSLPALDIWATVVVRKAVRRVIRENSEAQA